LPGDSLLFAVGALSARPASGIDLVTVTLLLIVAAIVGDAVNYKIGRVFGARAFAGQYKLIPERHLLRTRDFYDRYGGRAIIIARFAPILRTFAPFVAGFADMPFKRFFSFNVVGGIAWVAAFTGAGNFFGNIPAVKQQFHLVIIAIVVVSLIPAVVEALRARSDRPTVAS
jgi:membrane-associated protein